MKQLELLNNVERAKLLFDLFPNAMPGFLKCTKLIADEILKDPDGLSKQWAGGFITAGFWITLAKHTSQQIEKCNTKLHSSSSLIADQLFDGYNSMFCSHCLQQYVADEVCTDKKFAQMVGVLF